MFGQNESVHLGTVLVNKQTGHDEKWVVSGILFYCFSNLQELRRIENGVDFLWMQKAYSSIIPYGCLEFMRQVYVSTLKNFGFWIYLSCSLCVGLYSWKIPWTIKPQFENLKWYGKQRLKGIRETHKTWYKTHTEPFELSFIQMMSLFLAGDQITQHRRGANWKHHEEGVREPYLGQ